MKNFRLMVPICLALALCFYVIGCGNPSGDGSSPGGGTPATTTTHSGRLVDPAISGAIVLLDMNGDGLYNPLITGEMIATSDASGYFDFPNAMTIGATIEVLLQGLHLGIPYDAILKRTVDGTIGQTVSPLTTMLSNGMTAEAIVYLLQHYAGITIAADAVKDDPMYGLDLSNTDSIDKIRGAIAIYCLMQIISAEGGSSPGGYFDVATVETWGSGDIEIALGYMGSVVTGVLRPGLLTRINATVEVIRGNVNGYLTPFGISASIPAATADDIASTAFTITKWVMLHSIDNKVGGYDPGDDVIASIEAYAMSIGIRNYMLRNRTQVIVTIPVSGAPLPQGDNTYAEIIAANMISDGYFGLIPTGEVASTVKGYTIPYPYGAPQKVL